MPAAICPQKERPERGSRRCWEQSRSCLGRELRDPRYHAHALGSTPWLFRFPASGRALSNKPHFPSLTLKIQLRLLFFQHVTQALQPLPARLHGVPATVSPRAVPVVPCRAKGGWAASGEEAPATCNQSSAVEWVSPGAFEQLSMPGKP